MINILPSHIKEQVGYSKQNVRLLKFCLLTLVVAILLSGLIVGSSIYATRQTKQLESTLQQEKEAANAYQQTKDQVENLVSRVNLLNKLFDEKTQFSLVLQDIAAVLPSGSYITNIELTGDEKKPVKVVVVVDSFNKGGTIKNALVQSPRIKSADIQNITQNTATSYTVDIVIAFKDGS